MRNQPQADLRGQRPQALAIQAQKAAVALIEQRAIAKRFAKVFAEDS
jgi:hypothetical protein